MKKLMIIISSLAIVFGCMATVARAEDTNEALFPNGNMTTPNVPYVHYVDKHDDGKNTSGSTKIFIDVPEDLLKLNAEYVLLGREAFNEKYNTPLRYGNHENLACQIQVDSKFDDGEWLSEKGNWDKFEYGENMYDGNLNYRLSVRRHFDDTDKLFSFEQSWLVYNDVENSENDFLQPYLKPFEDENGEKRYQLDTESHTFSYRVRFVVYTENWDDLDEGQEPFWFISEWSPVSSIGKDGNQETLVKSDKVEAPVLSDFSLIKNEDNCVEAKYYVDFTKNTYDSIKYFTIIDDYFEPFVIESQIRVNDGDWVDTYTANAADLSGGYRTTASDDVEITMDSQVEIRVRIVCRAMNGEKSEWSNIVGNKPSQQVDPVTPDTPAQEHKCHVCGICPIQPLGICLFIWLLIIIILIVLIIVAFKSMKKKREKKKNNKA